MFYGAGGVRMPRAGRSVGGPICPQGSRFQGARNGHRSDCVAGGGNTAQMERGTLPGTAWGRRKDCQGTGAGGLGGQFESQPREWDCGGGGFERIGVLSVFYKSQVSTEVLWRLSILA